MSHVETNRKVTLLSSQEIVIAACSGGYGDPGVCRPFVTLTADDRTAHPRTGLGDFLRKMGSGRIELRDLVAQRR